MKIFNSAQTRELDKYTIEHEPIRSADLMERAARALVRTIAQRWDRDVPVVVFAGPGNNGGDALAVSRLLQEKGYAVATYLFNITGSLSADCAEMRKRLTDRKNHQMTEVTQEFDPPHLDEATLVVDGLFGSGLNKPLAGGFASLVKYINASGAQVVSIDLPSGLMSEDNTYNVRANIIRARLTLTFQQLKLSFLFAENQLFTGEVEVLDIGLSPDAIDKMDAQWTITEADEISAMLRPRDPFAHKGTMGHALIVSGSYGMAGAAVLATRACMRAGAGKVTVHTPKRNAAILQSLAPEAVLHLDREETIFSEPVPTDDFQALAIGPGLGTTEQTAIAMIAQLRRAQCPAVADADALNILAAKHAWMQQLPKGIILTPHAKELDRMEGLCVDSYERLTKARRLAERLQGYVVLKGRYTAICMPDGHVAFNPTGNAGMATAGSGDVLTGIIAALLAQGLSPAEAAVCGVFIHGRAGDRAFSDKGNGLIASDIVEGIAAAMKNG